MKERKQTKKIHQLVVEITKNCLGIVPQTAWESYPKLLGNRTPNCLGITAHKPKAQSLNHPSSERNRLTLSHNILKGNITMIITEEISIYNFEPWAGAVLTYDILFNNNKLDEVEQYIEECYPNGIDKGHLNDLMWHDAKGFLEQFGCIKSESKLEDFVAENCLKIDPENGQKIILSYEDFYAIFEDDFNVYEWDIIRPNYQNWVENLVDIDI